jgi:RimJ/RimL family protein N-acetyltransferase
MPLALTVREMKLSDVGLIIAYFHDASPEHLAMIGVDRGRLPDPARWRELYRQEYERPVAQRRSLQVIWERDAEPIGFSVADKIIHGREAHMHLHIVAPALRRSGLGTACVSRTARLYLEALALERLFCEPNAFNVAPNRTLQRAGFRYVKTYETIPGPLNVPQAVTRWVLERADLTAVSGDGAGNF